MSDWANHHPWMTFWLVLFATACSTQVLVAIATAVGIAFQRKPVEAPQ
jgi:hypothetical protein